MLKLGVTTVRSMMLGAGATVFLGAAQRREKDIRSTPELPVASPEPRPVS